MITRKDIAERANVSVSVVSRALNNSGYVAAEKKQKIIRIAQELGYAPNPVAMSLSNKRTKQILFYCKDLRNAFNIETYEGMFQAAQREDYIVVINGDINFTQIKDLMVDGLIFSNESLTAQYLQMIGKNYYLPAVTMGFGNTMRGEFQKSVPIVESDLWRGTELIFQYLWMKNHRKIAMITPYWWDYEEGRVIAWKQATRCDLGDRQRDYYIGVNPLEYPNDPRMEVFRNENGKEKNHIYGVCESFFEKGELAADLYLEKNIDATAVICFNDEMALGFCKRMKTLGYQIPKDLSVIGIDGVYSRRYASMELTSLHLNAKCMGKKCVEILLDKINGRKTKSVTQVPLKMIEGNTVRTLW